MSPALLHKSASHPIYATEPRDSGDLRAVPSLAAELDRAGVTSLPMPQIAVFVGSLKGTDVSLNIKDGPRIHTFLGYIAWRIAGDAGLDLIRGAEDARTSRGSELMVEVSLTIEGVETNRHIIKAHGDLPGRRCMAKGEHLMIFKLI